jgi:hypothetical protein
MSQWESTQPRRRTAAPSPPVHDDEEGELSAFIDSLPDDHDLLSDDEGVDLPYIDSLHPSMPPLEPATPPPSPKQAPAPPPALNPIQRYITPPSIHLPFPHWDDEPEEKKRQPTPTPPRIPSTFPRWDAPTPEQPTRQRTVVPDSDIFVDPNAPFTPPSQAAEEWYFRLMSQPREEGDE